VSGKPGQYVDLSVFVREQEAFRSFVSCSALPGIELDVSDGNVESACTNIADFLESKGLLGLP
jgi:hypothetical protein